MSVFEIKVKNKIVMNDNQTEEKVMKLMETNDKPSFDKLS